MTAASEDQVGNELAQGKLALLFSVATFSSAFLLFQVQPLVSKAILPWFGGAPSVWTTCLLFFQSVLFAGYAYAHLLVKWLPDRRQVYVQLMLFVVAAIVLRVIPTADWKPTADDHPNVHILIVLAATVGMPYFLLSTSGPLLQRWWSRLFPGGSPYRLYAISNAGSLLALLSYPVLFEPTLTLDRQGTIWGIGFLVYLVLAGVCGWSLIRRQRNSTQSENLSRKRNANGDRIDLGRVIEWFLMAMIPSAGLLAITNRVCLDVAVIPFLWVVPLSLYLVSFIVCFESDRWYRRGPVAAATCTLIAIFCGNEMLSVFDSLYLEIGLYLVILFAICMMCHGEVARVRPSPEHLTAYYLTLSAAGAAGGLFVALIAPLVFPDFWEFNICLLAAMLCSLLVMFDRWNWMSRESRARLPATAMACVLIAGVVLHFTESIANYRSSVAMTRNFYGVLEIEIDEVDDINVMRHGNIIHGLQHRSLGRRSEPTSYYSQSSGVGRVIRVQQSRNEEVRVGLVGLGVGTLAAYGREGDLFRFYEINEAVIEQAEGHFSFMEDTRAQVEIVRGDARLVLESESDQGFDLLVLDAFSGDAIPTHLLTKEAFAGYLQHVDGDGLIAVHISNLYFDLRPVVDAIGDEFELASRTIIVPEVSEPVDPSSEWILLARHEHVLDSDLLKQHVARPQPHRVLWTDQFSNLFTILK